MGPLRSRPQRGVRLEIEMSELGFSPVEQGMRLAPERAAVLAADAANAHTPGFIPRDLVPRVETTGDGLRFAAALREPENSESGGLEFTMAATAENSIRFRALADQERAMIREFRTVAEESRR